MIELHTLPSYKEYEEISPSARFKSKCMQLCGECHEVLVLYWDISKIISVMA
jgi:hypothetical protein